MPVFDFSSASEEKEAFVCTYTCLLYTSVYLVVAKFKVFNSLQFIIGIIGRIVSGLFTTYIVRLVDKLTQK